MWLLESDGDVFHGKKLWLRPGKKFIFGRTSAEAGGFVVENKTISRKHLIVEVDAVKPGDSTRPSIRSQITLEDLNTKIGTLVNGTQIRGTRYRLENDRNDIKLGQYEKLFRYITWTPVVFSFSFTSKELKANPMPSICQHLEPLDIKVILDYVREGTTHVVARKRNISKCLQALINGKYIVDHTFLDAIVNITHAKSDETSPLESDFENNWPKELEHLPPRGSENTERTSKAYAPDLGRQEIFDGYTFIFCDQSQFDNLLGPITNGRGKALLRQIDPSTTKLEDFIGYVKNVAGEKGLGEFEDGSEGKGVVVVRFQPAKGPASDWYAEFARRVALSLDHRLVEQNEFLDAILNNNASVLRKPLEIEQSGTVAPPQPPVDIATVAEAPSKVMTPTIPNTMDVDGESLNQVIAPIQAPRRVGRSRRTISSRFRGFDDGFDTVPLPESVHDGQGQWPPPETQGLFVSQLNPSESFQQPPGPILGQSRSSRKRILDLTIEEEDEEDVLDQLAPAATNLKRRRLADELANKSRGESPPLRPVTETVTEVPIKRNRKTKPEIDVLEVARQRREKEEEIARAEREALQEAMDGMDIEQIRNLVIIEEIDVQRSNPPLGTNSYGDEGSRWDDRWNGRKNFKKFRRRGENSLRVLDRVIVPLEEVKKKDFGIGDEYWLEGDKDGTKRRKSKSRLRNTQAQSADVSQSPIAVLETNVQDIHIVDESSLPLHQQRATRSQKPSVETDVTPTQPTQKKRAAEAMTKPAPKKLREAPRRQDSDESDDGLGFRFRKKR